MSTGIDVSKYQGRIDWPAVKKVGNIDFVSSQIGYNDTQYDATYIANRDGAASVGIPFMPYKFAYPGDPVASARAFYKMMGPHQCRATFDIEVPGLDANYAYAALSELEQLLQYTPYGYTDSGYLISTLHNDPRLAPFFKWIANYTQRPGDFGRYPPPWPWDIHQYSSILSELGISGRVDFDYAPTLSNLLIAHTGAERSASMSRMVAHIIPGEHGQPDKSFIITLNDADGKGNGNQLIAEVAAWNPNGVKVQPTVFHLNQLCSEIVADGEHTIFCRYPDGSFPTVIVDHGIVR